MDKEEIINSLNNDELVILNTETVLGIFSKADKLSNAIKLNTIKNRDKNQQVQIIVSDFKQLEDLCKISPFQNKFLHENFPNQASYILSLKKHNYNLSFDETIQVRMPSQSKAKELVEIIKKTGPLYATSANMKGEPPFQFVEDAMQKFKIKGLTIDSSTTNKQSAIYSLIDDKLIRLR